jgi:integrase
VSAEYTVGQHRGKLVLRYKEGGRWVRVSLGTADRGLAEARAGQIWSARNTPVSERIADLWPAYVRERKLAGAKSDRWDATWKALAPHFGHRIGSAITKQDCHDYRDARKRAGKADSTIRTELELLRACLNSRYKGAAPALYVPPASAPRDRYLTREDLLTLLTFIETPHVRLFVILAVTTGARMGAMLDAKWDQVDLERGTIHYDPAGRHRTNKRRPMVPLNERALAEMRAAREGALTDYIIEWNGERVRSVKKAIRAAAARSGIPCSPHVFRHTAGVWMAEADIPMHKIAQYLGHTSTKVTEAVYARFSPSFMRDASDALNF